VYIDSSGWIESYLFTKVFFMAKEDTVRIDGSVEELLPNMTFVVLLQNGVRVTAYLCGKMRMKNIRVLAGDVVTVEMSPYDLTKARIVYRQK
jgi:translation initiation factor IF-1